MPPTAAVPLPGVTSVTVVVAVEAGAACAADVPLALGVFTSSSVFFRVRPMVVGLGTRRHVTGRGVGSRGRLVVAGEEGDTDGHLLVVGAPTVSVAVPGTVPSPPPVVVVVPLPEVAGPKRHVAVPLKPIAVPLELVLTGRRGVAPVGPCRLPVATPPSAAVTRVMYPVVVGATAMAPTPAAPLAVTATSSVPVPRKRAACETAHVATPPVPPPLHA